MTVLNNIPDPSIVEDKYHIGLHPFGHDSFPSLVKKAYNNLQRCDNPLEKYIFLSNLRNTNVDLFYSIVLNNIKEIAPIIYTPTVGTACMEYSNIYPFLAPPDTVDGLFININQVDEIDEITSNYKRLNCADGKLPDITVITDGSRILGLGDLGVNGMGIPVGKLELYVAGAGLDPSRCLPIVVDFGTNNEKFINDPNYLGIRQKRPDDAVFYKSMDKIISGIRKAFPEIFIQFEDFSTEHAFELLEIYRNKITCFNDDIQGTGAVIMSGFINAIKHSGLDPLKHRILFSGAGSAGIGVAEELVRYFVVDHGVSVEDARKMFWLFDSRGLITTDRGDTLAEHKIPYARSDNNGQQFKTLIDTINYVKPSALLGLSTVKGQFSAEVLSQLNSINVESRPIVFALSNPESKAECTFKEAMIHTNNRVIYASGTAFPSYTIPETGVTKYPGQGNNMYIFPAIGQAAVLAKPEFVTNTQIYTVSKALANSLNESESADADLYPKINRLREVSAQLAAAMIHQSVVEGLARDQFWIDLVTNDPDVDISSFNPKKPTGFYSQKVVDEVKLRMWSPNSNSDVIHKSNM